MGNRWIVLGVLAFAQLVLGLQCVGMAVSLPWLIGEFGLGRAAAGQLVGLYLLPAVLFALPMARRRRRLGNRPALLLGAACMTLGGFAAAAAGSATTLAVGQAIAGAEMRVCVDESRHHGPTGEVHNGRTVARTHLVRRADVGDDVAPYHERAVLDDGTGAHDQTGTGKQSHVRLTGLQIGRAIRRHTGRR